MKCPRCQQENPPQAKFCLECATPLALRCANCGTLLPAGAKFCFECATPVSVPGSAPRFASPDAYTPKHLAERIINSKAALEGERKQVTVLFADLKGSMELLADRDPEEARKLLDPVIEHMMEAVHRYEGTVNQVMGDGIMALFGAPVAHEDHAIRACYAALRMQETVKRYAEGARRAEGILLQIRVGLNSGEVVVRFIGSDLHMDYTAVGQTTHVAARMEQMAKPGSILLSVATLALAEGYVELTSLGPLPVKGLAAPLEVYELTGAATIRSRLQTAAARGLTRFVGRESELEQLRQTLERARVGHGQVVAVVGEPGVGKSRLYWEFTHSHRAQGWLVLESGSVSYGKATNYLPIVDLLRAYFKIDSADDPRSIREKVTGKLLSLDRQLEPCVSPFLWLLDIAVEDESWQRLDPTQRRQRILDGVKRLLLRESQVQPLMVVFEDLHWIDAETQAFLDSLIETLPTARLLLLVNYRPEYSHGWGSKTYYRQVQIDPLPPESAETVLGALLGSDATLVPLKRLVIERTEGNPFFIEETVRSLVETGVLAGERGAYRVTRVVQDLQVPATAQAMLAARIDRLAAEDKHLLQAAAVIGTDVPFELLAAVADEPEERLRRGLSQLQATEFLYETRLFPDLEYTFRHALTHEVAYGSLLAERRRALHARIVAAMERLYADRLPEHLERLAHHAVCGELGEKAVSYLHRSGLKACDRSANWESVRLFEQALASLRSLPQTSEVLEKAIDLRFDIRTALTPLGENRRVLGYLREAEQLATTTGDQRRLGWTFVFQSAASFYGTGNAAEAHTLGVRALRIAEALADASLEVAALHVTSQGCYGLGDYPIAERYLRREIALLTHETSRQRFGLVGFPAPMARTLLALILADRGEFARATECGQEAVRLAEEVDHPYSLISACSGLAYVSCIKGDLTSAVPRLEQARQLAREWEIPLMSAYPTALLGYVSVRSGAVEQGLSLLTEAMTMAQSAEVSALAPILLVRLGEACLVAGRGAPANTFAETALRVAREGALRGGEAWALWLLGETFTQFYPDDPESAHARYHEAQQLADELGMRPLAAHCRFGLAKLYRRTGKQQEAQEHFTAATTMYSEMGMRYWLEKAEAEIGPLA